MNEKVKQYIELKKKAKEIENAMKFLEEDIKKDITQPVAYGGQVLSKVSRTTYALIPGVDLAAIKDRYPGICTTICGVDPTKIDIEVVKSTFPEAYYEKVDVNAKDLFKVAENPTSLVEEKVSTFLQMKEDKSVPEVDF